jgi:hypothetical protein
LQSLLRDSVDGERHPEVGTGEFDDRARENETDKGDLLVRVVDGIDMTLREVRCKARCSFEKGQHPFDDLKVKFDPREESDHIICIKRSTETEIGPSQLLQKPLIVSLADQGMEALHHKHKDHGRERVPLPKTVTMENPFPGVPLRRILVLEMERMVEIQSIQLRGHPTTTRRSRRKTHPTESNASARSILNMI